MPEFPTTRIGLLMQVRDPANHTAWEEFANLYRPVIYRFARQRGLQEADAEDLAQNVLAAVADQISEWEPSDHRARFRTWLSRVAMNQTITMFRRRKTDAARGGTTAVVVLQNHQDEATGLELNYRREVFRAVARRVRSEFEEATWQAFWLTAVDGVSIKDTATSLGRSVGSVYTARSRVIRRLQELVRKLDEDSPNWTADSEESK